VGAAESGVELSEIPKNLGMHCSCDELPRYTYYEASRGLSQKIRPFVVSVAKSEWQELFRCEICGIHWRVEIEDRFQQRYAWKVGEFRDDWAGVQFIEEQKALLLQRRGGETTRGCAWIKCERMRVRGVAYCIDHLFDTGARR
jgi:hypothetical protein